MKPLQFQELLSENPAAALAAVQSGVIDPNAKQAGLPPLLSMALDQDRLDVAEALLGKGADKNAYVERSWLRMAKAEGQAPTLGMAPIHFARSPEAVKLLASVGANLDAPYKHVDHAWGMKGETALHTASLRGDATSLAVAEALIAAGANVSLPFSERSYKYDKLSGLALKDRIRDEPITESITSKMDAMRAGVNRAVMVEDLPEMRIKSQDNVTEKAPVISPDLTMMASQRKVASVDDDVLAVVPTSVQEGHLIELFEPKVLGNVFNERVAGSGEFFRKGGKDPAFIDQGANLKVHEKTSESYQAVMELAKTKGWHTIELNGPIADVARGWVEAEIAGIKVANFHPTDKDLEELQKRRDEIAAQERSSSKVPEGAQLATAGRFIGPVVDVKDGFAIQQGGRGQFYAHDLSKFDKAPQVGESMDVHYDKGVPNVPRGQDHQRSANLGR